MSLRVRERLGTADLVTLLNAGLGVAAIAAAFTGTPGDVARVVLLAAVADGLDGIIARRWGGTAVGPYLDSMADVVSFGTAPAVFVFAVALSAWAPLSADPFHLVVAVVVPATFVVFSLVRTGLYTVYVGEDENRPGIQNTLAASILAAGYLAGVTDVWVVLAATVVLSVLMVAPVPYPKLAARDALVMGVVQVGAIAQPAVLERVFPRLLLLAALAYMCLGPWYYWRS
jgi:archaetidylserine synthase